MYKGEAIEENSLIFEELKVIVEETPRVECTISEPKVESLVVES